MITKKIKSQKGATFIIALVYFLICMMVGAVMITAASADRGKSLTTVIEQRDYYAVQSAAILFRDAIAGISFYDEFEYYGDEDIKGEGSFREFKNSGYIIKNGKKEAESEADKAPYFANYRFLRSNPEKENIADPELTGVSADSEFGALYSELAKFFRYSFIKKIGMDTEAADLGLIPASNPDFSGTIQLDGGIPVSFVLKVSDEDYTITADFFVNADTPRVEGDPDDPAPADPGAGGDADAAPTPKNYSVSLSVKPLDSSIKRSTDKNPDPQSTVERRTVEYFIEDNRGVKKTEKQKIYVIEKACIDLHFNNAVLSRGVSGK